jgi:penicillin-binding protein 1A
VNLLEMVSAYCTPCSDGVQHDPVLVSKIEDRDGNVIYEAPTDGKQAIPYRSAFLVQQLLMGGMSGTSSRLRGFVGYDITDTDFGGKTGTSNNHSDAWFIGTTPNLVCGAWVGGEYRCIHFRTGQLGQGNRTALPICGYFLGSVLKDPAFKKYRAKFGAPRDAALNQSMYGCGGYLALPSDSDSLGVDSLRMGGVDDMIELDADGNPLKKAAEHHENEDANQTPTPNNNGEATEKKD